MIVLLEQRCRFARRCRFTSQGGVLAREVSQHVKRETQRGTRNEQHATSNVTSFKVRNARFHSGFVTLGIELREDAGKANKTVEFTTR